MHAEDCCRGVSARHSKGDPIYSQASAVSDVWVATLVKISLRRLHFLVLKLVSWVVCM